MTHDEILDTIQRLLKLSESPNEHEARAAMAKAQEWMIRFNVAAEDLRAADAGAAGFIEEEIWERASVHPAWPPIFAVLARHFFVRVLTQRRRSEVHAPWRSVVTLFGTRVNVAIASHVAVYLFRVFTALWKDEWWRWARRRLFMGDRDHAAQGQVAQRPDLARAFQPAGLSGLRRRRPGARQAGEHRRPQDATRGLGGLLRRGPVELKPPRQGAQHVRP